MQQTKTNSLLIAIAVLAATLQACKKSPNEPEPDVQTPYVSQVFDYKPAPGQFINTGTGNEAAASGILGNKDGLVSLGAYGGYIVLGFDHPVVNRAGDDIIVYGNAFNSFAEPGIVWVMPDTNNNGKPDDTWYELAGSAQNQQGYLRNYTITYKRPTAPGTDIAWTDNRGQNGVVKANSFHTQSYYPDWVTANSYTLTGTLLPSVNIDDSNSAYITSNAFAFGYADNTAGGDKVDIANAIDSNGNKVSLGSIKFIKIQTAIAYNLGWLGELSTEVAGVADLSLLKN